MRRTLIKALLIPLVALSAWPAAQAADNFKIMIGANPGGGFDQTGRGLGKALQEAGVASAVTYENKGGAGGTIALAQFVNASKGDPNAMIVTGAVMVGAIVQNNPPITLSQADGRVIFMPSTMKTNCGSSRFACDLITPSSASISPTF